MTQTTTANSRAEVQLALTRAALRHACVLLVRKITVQPVDPEAPLNEEERLLVDCLTTILMARSVNMAGDIEGGAA